MRRYGDNVTTDDVLDQQHCESSQGTRVMFGGCGWGLAPIPRPAEKHRGESIIDKLGSFLKSQQSKTTSDKK